MPKREIYVCDGCGAEKGVTNFWYKVRTGDAIHVYPFAMLKEGGDDASIKVEYCCGAECVTKKVAEFMSEKKRLHDNGSKGL